MEVTGVRGSHKGGTLMMELVPLKRRHIRCETWTIKNAAAAAAAAKSL